MFDEDTIIGLSSGGLPSGIAVIRLSGPNCRISLAKHGICELHPRKASLVSIKRPGDGELLDRGLCIWFPSPYSFTGQDCAELHIHGGRAVVDAVLNSFLELDGVRLADAGEFTRRAFENGKFDLTEVEGISDILSSQTEAQRKQAVGQIGGKLREIYEEWRKRLIKIQAMIEAEIDFSDEDDIPADVSARGIADLILLKNEIGKHLNDGRSGEIIRDGFRVVIMGAPNTGKSTLINAFAKREVAIVTEQAGTTRDIIDVHLNIGGYEVIVSDTAGIRPTEDVVEREGIHRAESLGREADLIVWLSEQGADTECLLDQSGERYIFLRSKDDEGVHAVGESISCITGHGMDWLLNEIKRVLKFRMGDGGEALITRKRHRLGLMECEKLLEEAINCNRDDLDILAEVVRNTGTSLSRLTGRIDVEDLLDVIFAEFCVGK
ncbi:MAG: tRNA uridine-5-carboxymethylaminomethyl(34) synthesis GTPase MnmE [Rhizobiaceae bacterium]